MSGFDVHEGKAVHLPLSDVNTDDIIPARFLKTVRRTGFAEALFANWRYDGDDRTPNPLFPLNADGTGDPSILVAGENFGCGSSREHAPWALREYGFRCIIAPSFADIFYNNCFNSGILPVPVTGDGMRTVLSAFDAAPTVLRVDLPAQRVVTSSGTEVPFEVNPFNKSVLANGQDKVAWTLSHVGDIETYEMRARAERPWLFMDELFVTADRNPGAPSARSAGHTTQIEEER
ncbi:3-isopropylmalate dehydratase small subunit [Dietzia sp. B19]|uniref:3-isopropylmalate dehydratase small subunit n=1 Tax=Dietzia sp. B19 TaxID=1630632 RepID=UPI0015FD3CE8|nr:3-isopropylmalate dehydratase small subunit [Dietzia sp. B19]